MFDAITQAFDAFWQKVRLSLEGREHTVAETCFRAGYLAGMAAAKKEVRARVLRESCG